MKVSKVLLVLALALVAVPVAGLILVLWLAQELGQALEIDLDFEE